MYTDPTPRPRGLGYMPVTAYTVGGGSSHPCQDFAFKLRNRAACARMGYNGTPTPAEQKGKIYDPPPAGPTPTTIVFPQGPIGDPPPPPAPIIQTFDVPETQGGGGGGGSTTVYELIPGAPETFGDPGGSSLAVDVDAPSRGFGIVEAAIAAGLAFLIARSYQ